MPVSTIRMTFEGMMVLFVREGGSYCHVGILKQAPNHAADILITRIPECGAPQTMLHLHDDDFESRMWLDVDKFEAGITLFKDESQLFQRATDQGNPIDFRWALDFEGDEMYDFKVPVDFAGFKSVLRINDGTFYTQEKSRNELLIRPWHQPEVRLGRVAVRLRADITLDGQSAYFQNGHNVRPLELKAQERVNYGIYISHARHQHSAENEHSAYEIDAENYNSAVAVDRPYHQKIHFDRVDQRSSPDAVCLTAAMSQTEPGY